MATLNYSFTPDTTYTGTYTVKLFLASDLTTPVGTQTFSGPYTGSIPVSFPISTITSYVIRVYADLCSSKIVKQDTINFPNTCQPPNSISYNTITSTGVTVTWSAPSGIDTGIYDYDVTNVSTSTVVQTGSVSAYSVAITGLTTGTQYLINIYSQCAMSVDSSPASVTITTL